MAVINYLYDKEVDSLHVVCGQCALARNGLTTHNPVVLEMFTPYEKLDGISIAMARYLYRNPIDYSHFVRPMHTNHMLLLPTPERAIVEYVLCEKWCDEGVLIEALQSYVEREDNVSLLFQVADFFCLERAQLEYWLKEADEDEEV